MADFQQSATFFAAIDNFLKGMANVAS